MAILKIYSGGLKEFAAVVKSNGESLRAVFHKIIPNLGVD